MPMSYGALGVLIFVAIVLLILSKAAKKHSLALAKKIAESERWPFDEWEIVTQGLSIVARLSRDDAVRRCKSSARVADYIFWFICCFTILTVFIWFTRA